MLEGARAGIAELEQHHGAAAGSDPGPSALDLLRPATSPARVARGLCSAGSSDGEDAGDAVERSLAGLDISK